jgi:hypothetical protein
MKLGQWMTKRKSKTTTVRQKEIVVGAFVKE